MKFEWDQNKNQINIFKHGIDFCEAVQILENPILEKIDNRKDYGEQRWIGLGQLWRAVVVIVYTIRNGHIPIISVRRANREETKIYKEKFWQSN